MDDGMIAEVGFFGDDPPRLRNHAIQRVVPELVLFLFSARKNANR
jgi:hypothetical protein